MPAPVAPGDLGVEIAEGEVDPAAELLTGGEDGFAFNVVEVLADGHAGVDDAAGDLAPADDLTGGEPVPIPGPGVLLPGVGVVVSLGGGATGGDVVAGGGIVGLALVEPVEWAGGLDLCAGGVVHVGPGPGWFAWLLEVGRALVPNAVPPPVPPPPPPLPPFWVEPLFEAPSAEAFEVGETTCGSSITAKPPAATTKTAMPMPATGRSQPYRGRAWPGLAVAGRKRSMTARQAAMTGSVQRRSQAALLADQADADSRDSIGRLSRSLIRSSPSADGSIESAAACSARRRASS
ncbi:MAG TPA: hypothetical protein VK586_13200 [Streptosporangiaceae bacterium]|nr:hypothetical protein [Streptosporangiaceae bacterium]